MPNKATVSWIGPQGVKYDVTVFGNGEYDARMHAIQLVREAVHVYVPACGTSG